MQQQRQETDGQGEFFLQRQMQLVKLSHDGSFRFKFINILWCCLGQAGLSPFSLALFESLIRHSRSETSWHDFTILW